MKESPQIADIRFNNGNGALLCNECRVIVAYGYDHEDKFHFCDKCENTHKWRLITVNSFYRTYINLKTKELIRERV